MGQLEQFRLPDVGEGLADGEILQWFVQPGEHVSVNQTIVEIETAKAAVELPCPYEGVVVALLADEGETVDVGTPIITIDTAPGEGAEGATVAGTTPVQPEGEHHAVLVGYGVKETSGTARRPRRPGGGSTRPKPPTRLGGMEVGRAVERALSHQSDAEPEPAPAGPVRTKPLVRRLAKDLGVDLTTVVPTGPHDTITRADVEAAATRAPSAGGRPSLRPVAAGPRERREPIKGVRRHMAEAMVASAFTAPHVTEWVQVDATRTMKLVSRLRETPAFKDTRVTPLTLFARAALLAARRHPGINAVWDGDAGEIVYKDYVNLGIAAATPRGLLVPNIKDADQLSLPDLAGALTDLVDTAKAGKTAPAELTGGTFTITNIGVFGIDGGTPIINPGESAILAVGAVTQRPWVHKGKVRPRWVVELAVSFDHRLIDGELGSRFLADIAALVEDPAVAVTWV